MMGSPGEPLTEPAGPRRLSTGARSDPRLLAPAGGRPLSVDGIVDGQSVSVYFAP
jgi:hypothetical protein